MRSPDPGGTRVSGAAPPPPAALGSGDTFRGRESEALDGYGMANYAKIFRGRQQNVIEPVELGEFADWLGSARGREGGDRDLVGPVQHLRGRGHPRPARSLPGIRLHQPLGRHERRARARAPGARARLLRTDRVDLPRTPAGRRCALVPALRQVRRARDPGADLLGDDLRQRSPLRHRSSRGISTASRSTSPSWRSSRRWAAGRGSPSWWRSCSGTPTSTATRPLIGRATWRDPGRDGRCCSSSATTGCRTR